MGTNTVAAASAAVALATNAAAADLSNTNFASTNLNSGSTNVMDIRASRPLASMMSTNFSPDIRAIAELHRQPQFLNSYVKVTAGDAPPFNLKMNESAVLFNGSNSWVLAALTPEKEVGGSRAVFSMVGPGLNEPFKFASGQQTMTTKDLKFIPPQPSTNTVSYPFAAVLDGKDHITIINPNGEKLSMGEKGLEVTLGDKKVHFAGSHRMETLNGRSVDAGILQWSAEKGTLVGPTDTPLVYRSYKGAAAIVLPSAFNVTFAK
jgi:hypothetical protein